jgi:hypothetical protein
MSSHRTVTAVFDEVRLTIVRTGRGSGTVSGSGIDCGTFCSSLVSLNTPFTLTATAAPGSTFEGWQEDPFVGCGNASTCAFTMTESRTIYARFSTTFELTVDTIGEGEVTSSPGGIDCGGDCAQSYQDGTQVALTATPKPGWLFAQWSDDCSGPDPCSVTMNEDKHVTAQFAEGVPLDLSFDGGKGRVTSSPAGVDCTGDCSTLWLPGSVVTLTATPEEGFTFIGWSGDCTGLGTCQVVMSPARQVYAKFEADR